MIKLILCLALIGLILILGDFGSAIVNSWGSHTLRMPSVVSVIGIGVLFAAVICTFIYSPYI